jgi:vacuolar-type H+-ATPase subunit H
MVTPSIKKIREVEKDCQKKLEQAHLQAEAIIQDALNRKIELIVQARKETQKTMEELARQAEEDARGESKKIADKEKEKIKKLKKKVKPRFHKSLSRILREMGIQLK